MIVYGDDSNFTKFGRIAHTAAGDEKFEFIYENAGTPRNEAADSDGQPARGLPGRLLRPHHVRRDQRHRRVLEGRHRLDARSGARRPLPANAKLGMFAFSNDGAGNPGGRVRLVHAHDGGAAARRPARAATTSSTARASTRRAGTRSSARTPTGYSVSGGELTITTQPGDIYRAPNPQPKNFILQSADHAGDGLGDRDEDRLGTSTAATARAA